MMTIDHVLQSIDRTFPVILRLVRIDRAGVDQFASGIDHRNFTAGAKTGIKTQDDLIGQRWLTEEGAQIVRKYLDGVIIGVFTFFASHIAFDSWQQETFSRISNGKLQLIGKG